MFPFGDPEWQLHIPLKEYTTIVLTHLYCMSTCRGPLCIAAGPSLSAPESGNGASGVAAVQAFVPARGILAQKVRLEQERSCIIYGYISRK